MAKDVGEAKALNIAGQGAAATPPSPRILSQEDALKFLQDNKLGNDVTYYVTEDKNAFTEDNKDYALNHAFKNNLKIFVIDAVK